LSPKPGNEQGLGQYADFKAYRVNNSRRQQRRRIQPRPFKKQDSFFEDIYKAFEQNHQQISQNEMSAIRGRVSSISPGNLTSIRKMLSLYRRSTEEEQTESDVQAEVTI